MTYRLLTDSEKLKIKEIWPHYGGTNLDGVLVAGAVDDEGRVRAFAVCHLVPHLEPWWIEQGAPVDFRRVEQVIEQNVKHPELWVFVKDDHQQRMAEICGAARMDYRVMRKELS